MRFWELAGILGVEAAEQLVCSRGGEDIRVPSKSSIGAFKRRSAILEDFEQGFSYQEVACRRNVSVSWAYRLWRQYRGGGE